MKLWRILGFLCLCPLAWGQGSRFDSNVFTSASNVPPGAQAPVYTLPSALITVCAYPATGNPCTNAVNVYSDPALTQVIRQPIKADVHGRFGFWAAPGQYSYSVVAGQAIIGTYNFSLAGDGGGSATFPSTPGIVWNLNNSAGRNATASDITGLFSGTGPCFLMKDGTCGSAGNGTLSNFTATSWPTWLVPSVTSSTTTPNLSVAANPIPNSALANASMTVNSTICALGGTCTIPFNTIYPPAGVAVSNGTNWLPSLVPPSGALVGTTDTQTLTNKTLTSPALTGTATAVNLTVTGTCTGCGGSMTWPGAPGIAVYAGSNAWGTSKAAPTGALVGDSDTQTLTNKTLGAGTSFDDGTGTGGGFSGLEGTAIPGAISRDGIWPDSTAHRWMMNNNNGVNLAVAGMLTGTTGTITGTALSGSCDSGTATVTGAVVGTPVLVSATDGVDVGATFVLRGSVTATSTVTVYICGTGTPASKAYNVTVIQ